MKSLVRPDDLARMLGVSKGLVYKMAKTGVIPSLQLGDKSVRFDPDEIQEWLKNRKRKGGQ